MGDDPTPPGSDLPIMPSSHPGPAFDAHPAQYQVGPGDIPSTYPHQLYSTTQLVYSTQFDMAQPQITARASPFAMNTLSNALPPNDYRQGPFNPSQLRYNPTVSSPTVVGQGQPMPQYSGQSQPVMNHMPNQTYYLQHPSQIPPYYGSPISPSQPQLNMSPRPNMPYYGNQVMTNPQAHPSMGYYYTQMPHFQPQGQPQHQAIPGTYMAAASGQHDPRLGAPQVGENMDGEPFSPIQQETRQGRQIPP